MHKDLIVYNCRSNIGLANNNLAERRAILKTNNEVKMKANNDQPIQSLCTYAVTPGSSDVIYLRFCRQLSAENP